jgi:hypothetical protein
MQHGWIRQVALGDPLHPVARHAMSRLAATFETAVPTLDHEVPEGRDHRSSHRHGVIGAPPAQDLGKPDTWLLDPVVPYRL